MAECAVLTMGGKDGVPLRFPRPVAAVIAAGTAAVAVGLSAAPASADQVRQQEWWLSALNIASAWTASQGSGVTVAVLSDGVDASQPDLTGVVTAAPALPGVPVATGQYFGEQGTPIASVIAGHGHGSGGSSGVVGVAPEARILSVPVTLPPDDPQLYDTSAGAIPSAIAAGIRYAVSHGASVIDLPIDPGQPNSAGFGGAAAQAGGSAAEQSAVSYALAHNVVLVAPAGDDALTTDAPNYPAAYPGVIAVGAFDSVFDKAPWTSRQSYVTLTAAGAGVIAASSAGGYETMNSTSAASAVVAGIVALIRSRYPSLPVADVRTALITTTLYHRADGLTDGSGYGAVDAAPALGAAAALATPAKDRAGAGAQPLATLSPAAAGAGAPSLGPQIVRAGELSAGVLVLLLLAVVGYAVARRRRPGSLPALAAEWTAGQTQSRYPHAVVTPTDADRILELFATPTAPPGPPGGELATPGRHMTAMPTESERAERATTPAATGDAGQWVPHGPAAGTVARRAVVAGAPPWEPAAPPDGALPWSDTPGRQLVAGHLVDSGRAEDERAPAPPAPEAQQSARHRADEPAFGPTWSVEPDFDDRSSQPGRSGFAYPPTPSGGRTANSRPDWALPAGWPGWPDGGSADSSEPAAAATAPPASVASDEGTLAGASPPGQHSSGQHSSGQHRSGLPIRQPRPVGRAPLSPSGSLWESASGGGSLWERAEKPVADPADSKRDPSGRPIYVWERPEVAADSQAGQSAD